MLGETVTTNDTALCSILTALDIISDFLLPQQSTPHLKILITSPSNVAITKALDISPHEEQLVSLECLEKIGAIVDLHPNVNIRLLWLPRSITFVGFRRAKQLALEAICTAVINEVDEPHSIKNQKAKKEEEHHHNMGQVMAPKPVHVSVLQHSAVKTTQWQGPPNIPGKKRIS